MRRWFPLLAALWIGGWPFSQGLAAEAADAVLQAGAALASGQYAAAGALAMGGLSETGLDDLTRARLLVVRGLSQQAQGQADDALVDFTRALQTQALQGEERARALFARGLSLDGAGRLKEALGDYSAALTVAPDAPYALNNRANVHRRQGRFEEAKRDYAAALAANTPNPQYPYFGLGQIAEAEGDAEMARNFYSRAITADPAFQLARDRLQAMGPPAEGRSGPSTDRGVIVLRPPPPRGKEAPIQLQPPARRAETAVPPAFSPALSPVMTVAAPAGPPPPGRGAPLRPAIVPTAVDGATGKGLVQLGAWRSETEAREGWAVAQRMAGETLAELPPLIVRAELPGRGVYYRLRIAANGPASQFCAALTAKGLACFPVRD
jgi:tetratricopeptide (TPR) repeat protein